MPFLFRNIGIIIDGQTGYGNHELAFWRSL